MDLSAVMSMNVPLKIAVTKMLHVLTHMAVSRVNVTKDTMEMESYVMILMSVKLIIHALDFLIASIILVDTIVNVKPDLLVSKNKGFKFTSPITDVIFRHLFILG